jgi:large subunit ribosomal protein L43
VNGRDKVICVRNLPPPSILAQAELLLDSSGSKITTLKRPKVESTNESVRGIWSAFHEERR